MAYVERIRDMIAQPLLEEIVRQRTAGGMAPGFAGMAPGAAGCRSAHRSGAFPEDIPYGLRISEDCKRLEVDPNENQALLQMMEMLVQDFPFSAIVSDLNEKGFRTRDGRRWSPVAIFNMIPRLIEVGPRLFSTEEWEVRRQKFARMT